MAATDTLMEEGESDIYLNQSEPILPRLIEGSPVPLDSASDVPNQNASSLPASGMVRMNVLSNNARSVSLCIFVSV